jgi:KipI family sensor histidine kinase inhibitor
VNAEWRVEYLGDAALSVRPLIEGPLEANAWVHRLATRLRRAQLTGVRDIVPGMRDLVVHVDPLRCVVDEIERALLADSDDPLAPMHRTHPAVVEIPVTYGGDDGPDLAEVADACGLSAAEVCERHAAAEYVVCFVGFLPGFPYLGLLDPALRVPRRRTPRPRVPAGSVAIAGEYTGVYPWASPGGWHLIGRTDVTLFDLDADPPARLAPGNRVRFRVCRR